jgi:ABC-type glycerol-3-phosphate transport system substrate-binding protein
MASAIALIAELEQTGVMFQAASGLDWYSSITGAMNSGQLGFWTSDAGEQKFDISGAYPLTINVGIAPLPYTDKPNGSYALNDMYGLYISNKTDNPEACWELAKYLSEGVDALKGVPARTSVANSPEWEAFVGEENATVYRVAFSRNLSSAEIDRYSGLFWSPIRSWIGQATMNIREGNDPAQELAMAQQYADAYLACMAPYDVLRLGQDELREITDSCAVEVDPSRQ